VLVAGGQILSGLVPGTDRYAPGAIFDPSWQPRISSASLPLGLGSGVLLHGLRFRGISEASGGNGNQDSSTDYPLVQLRSLATDQTMFLAPSNWTATTFLSAPLNNFPAGWAMATVFANGIPSAPSLLLVGAPSLAWDTIAVLADGSCRLTFTNLPNFGFSVLASTDVTSPLTDWTLLGAATEISPGHYQFIDLLAPAYPHRFYRIRWP
jgi:hypothetical protein